ncbi:RNA polymerase sigma factor [Nocardioides mangrovicus]|uniref:RNA polymerase sigma factor n=1 Tax=Nocardioides mangrovicus TaxID=2478913 RepID=A0A3L8P040_9ACTN|nr:RNA polymerase sigma factor [Nocardioides mangrovicus]
MGQDAVEASWGGRHDLESALAAARAGDEQGFAEVWRALHPPLLRYLTVRGDDAPEDLAADTWMHVVRGLAGFSGGVPEFRAWLFTIARHRAVDQARARDRRPRLVLGADDAAMPETGVAPSAEHEVDEREATARALRLVATLPALQAEMVVLRVVAGLDVADVARLLGKKPGTVRVTVHRALRALAKGLRESPEAPPGREVGW